MLPFSVLFPFLKNLHCIDYTRTQPHPTPLQLKSTFTAGVLQVSSAPSTQFLLVTSLSNHRIVLEIFRSLLSSV